MESQWSVEDECSSNTEKKAPRKDALGEEEKSLFVQGTKIHGNNWREIARFIFQNGKSLPKAVYQKYCEACRKEANMKSIKSRIGNLRRKTKNCPEITEREKMHAIETSSCKSVQELGVMIQHGKKKEADQRVKETDVPQEDSNEELHDGNNEAGEASSSGTENGTKPARRSSPKKRKRSKGNKSGKLDELMRQASAMMGVAAKAAKVHHRYIKAMAAEKDLSITSEDSSG